MSIRTTPRRYLNILLSQNYSDYVRSLSPVIWRRYNEISGTTGLNYGTLSTTSTWTPGTGSLGQTGKLGSNEAYSFDGANSKDEIPANAAFNNLTKYTLAILCNPTSAGESNVATLIGTDTSTTRMFYISGVNRPLTWFHTRTGGGTDAITETNNSFFSLSTWQLFFATYDNTGDRKGRIYKYVGATLTEATYATQTAMVGTIALPTTQILVIGNRAAQDRTFNGLIDEVMFFPTALTVEQMTKMGTLIKGL